LVRITSAAVPAARFSLVTEKRALTKFLKCVDWSDAQEAQQVRAAASCEQITHSNQQQSQLYSTVAVANRTTHLLLKPQKAQQVGPAALPSQHACTQHHI
jgi:hypothetical protein